MRQRDHACAQRHPPSTQTVADLLSVMTPDIRPYVRCHYAMDHGKLVDTLNEFGSPCDTIGYLIVTYTQHISLNIDLKRGVCLPTLETHGCQKRALA